MIAARALGVGLVGVMLLAPALHGQATSRYRDYQLGAGLASVSALAGVAATEATVVHQRPAVIQTLEWRRPYPRGGEEAKTDSAQKILFSFYQDQLFRMVVDYDRDRTQGMTSADMIQSLSAIYGPIVAPVSKTNRTPTTTQIEAESGTVVARWGNSESSVVLFSSSLASSFRLVVSSIPLEALAQTADTEARRLDEREAPQKELARQKKEADAEEAARQKAREANKATFRP